MKITNQPSARLQKGQFTSSIKKLASDGKNYLVPVIVAALLLIVSVVLQVLAPSYMQSFTDLIANNAITNNIPIGITASDGSYGLLFYGLILIVFYVIVALSSYFANFIMTTISQLYAASLRQRISKKINIF